MMTGAHPDPTPAVTLTKFSATGLPLLSAGSSMTLLTSAPGLWAHLKIYADGGENALHAHVAEDHMFFVLDGEATFTNADGNETVVERYEGMVVPRGTLYMFKCTGEGNLVMLRVGSSIDAAGAEWLTDAASGGLYPKAMRARVDDQNRDAHPDDAANRTGAVAGVAVPGRTFGG